MSVAGPDNDAQAKSLTPTVPEMCLLLLGKTGHGKSATGNAILGRRYFKTSPSVQSVTQYADVASGYVRGRQVKVVDTPGLVDTRLETDASAKAAMDAFSRGVSLCPDGFHALVLVFKYGVRMTNEEQMAIEKLKEMLGKDIIRQYTVLVITHGDIFDPEEVGMPFIDWVCSEGGYMKTLLQECDNRCVLFNNKTKDATELSRQRQELLDCVDALQSKGRKYTNWVFDQAKDTWQKLVRQRKYVEVITKVNAVLGDISANLLAAQEKDIKLDDEYYDELRMKLQELDGLMTDMEEPEKGKVRDQIMEMDERIQSVQKRQGDAEKMREELSEIRKHTEALKEQHKEEINRCQNEFLGVQKEMIEKMMEMQKAADERMERMLEEMKASQKGSCPIF